MSNSIVDDFRALVDEAAFVWEWGGIPDTNRYETAFIAVLNHVKANIEQRDTFIGLFIEALDNPSLMGWEIVMFCMRELKWKEVYDEVYTRCMQEPNWTIKRRMEQILEVYEDNWEDADLFRYYSDKM